MKRYRNLSAIAISCDISKDTSILRHKRISQVMYKALRKDKNLIPLFHHCFLVISMEEMLPMIPFTSLKNKIKDAVCIHLPGTKTTELNGIYFQVD